MPDLLSDSELDALVRATDPVDERTLVHPAQSLAAQALFERITGSAYRDVEPVDAPPAARPTRRGRRRLRLPLAALAAILALGGGVTYALTSGQPTQQAGVACFATDDVHGDHTATPVSGAGAVAACAAAWSAGAIPGQPAGTPPPLQACLLPYGTTGVFPDRDGSGGVCRRLGLQPAGTPPAPTTGSATASTSGGPTSPNPGQGPGQGQGSGGSRASTTTSTPPTSTPGTTVAPFVEANDTIVRQLLASCVDETSAEALVRRALDQAGLTNWTVEVAAPFTAARPCASPSYDQSTDTFYIVPIPPNQSPTSTSP